MRHFRNSFPIFLVLVFCSWRPAQADFCPGLAQVQFDRGRVMPGEILNATYTFRSNGPSDSDMVVFVHVVGPVGQRIGADFTPDYSTAEWPVEGFVRERLHPIAIPVGAMQGTYRVLVGMVRKNGLGTRVELANQDRHQGDREYLAGEFEVLPAGSSGDSRPVSIDLLPVDVSRLVTAPAASGHLELSIDRNVLRPMRQDEGEARLTLRRVAADGTSHDIPCSAAEVTARTKVASGNVDVVAVVGDRVTAREGGIATIEAVVHENQRRLSAAVDVCVAPFYRDYHQTLVLKLFLGMEGEFVERITNEPGYRKRPDVLCTFEEAAEVIRKTDNLTRGIPKIVYLVGWQTGGHDHGYPAWAEAGVNPRLKRPQDATAVDSLRWLIREARKFNTTVSLHINMVDAYRQSPLWDEYVAKDCIAKDVDGQPVSAGIQVKGEEMYGVVYPREWAEGLAQRRIDNLIRMLPELEEGHTIHIDVFVAQRDGGQPISPWHAKPENGGLTPERYVETQRDIFHYWRDRGFDVTGEGTGWAHPPGEHFIGLQPMAWWYSVDQMRIPECLSARGRTSRDGDGDFHFGSSMHGEEIWQRDKDTMPGFLGMFCRTTLPWYYLSRLERLRYEGDTLVYSEGVEAQTVEGKDTIRRGDFILRENDDLFVPALWNDKEIIAYSRLGYASKAWRMPAEWRDVRNVDIYRIALEGCEPSRLGVPVVDDTLTLALVPDEAVTIVPSGTVVIDPARPHGGNAEWRMRHGERLAELRLLAERCQVLFMGDSITEGWRTAGRGIWDRDYASLGAVNTAISGTETSNVLWQLGHGVADGVHPRVAVLMVGVNNVMHSRAQSAEDIARGIAAIVSELRQRLPRTGILLLGTFPKDESPDSTDRRTIQQINARIAELDDGRWVHFLDVGDTLLDSTGTLSKTMSHDGVHLTEQGYRVWSDAMLPRLAELLSMHGDQN